MNFDNANFSNGLRLCFGIYICGHFVRGLRFSLTLFHSVCRVNVFILGVLQKVKRSRRLKPLPWYLCRWIPLDGLVVQVVS